MSKALYVLCYIGICIVSMVIGFSLLSHPDGIIPLLLGLVLIFFGPLALIGGAIKGLKSLIYS